MSDELRSNLFRMLAAQPSTGYVQYSFLDQATFRENTPRSEFTKLPPMDETVSKIEKALHQIIQCQGLTEKSLRSCKETIFEQQTALTNGIYIARTDAYNNLSEKTFGTADFSIMKTSPYVYPDPLLVSHAEGCPIQSLMNSNSIIETEYSTSELVNILQKSEASKLPLRLIQHYLANSPDCDFLKISRNTGLQSIFMQAMMNLEIHSMDTQKVISTLESEIFGRSKPYAKFCSKSSLIFEYLKVNHDQRR